MRGLSLMTIYHIRICGLKPTRTFIICIRPYGFLMTDLHVCRICPILKMPVTFFGRHRIEMAVKCILCFELFTASAYQYYITLGPLLYLAVCNGIVACPRIFDNRFIIAGFTSVRRRDPSIILLVFASLRIIVLLGCLVSRSIRSVHFHINDAVITSGRFCGMVSDRIKTCGLIAAAASVICISIDCFLTTELCADRIHAKRKVTVALFDRHGLKVAVKRIPCLKFLATVADQYHISLFPLTDFAVRGLSACCCRVFNDGLIIRGNTGIRCRDIRVYFGLFRLGLFRFFGLFRLFLLRSRITAVLDHLTGCAVSGLFSHPACGCFHGNCPVTPCMHMHRGLFRLVCQTHRIIISNNIHGNSIGHPIRCCRNDSGAFLLTCHDTPAHGSYLCVGRLP